MKYRLFLQTGHWHGIGPKFYMKQKILIIDDEKDLCDLIKGILERENFSVDCAYTLKEATVKLNQHPAIILLDNNLPDGSGLDYLQLHPDPFMNRTVVFMTADPTDIIESKAKQEGAVAFPGPPGVPGRGDRGGPDPDRGGVAHRGADESYGAASGGRGVGPEDVCGRGRANPRAPARK